MTWLYHKFSSIRWGLWQLFVIGRFAITGDCGLSCGVVPIRQLDGTVKSMFVAEADCPIHDLELEPEVADARYGGNL